jgi:excisionase family DNA binding protein
MTILVPALTVADVCRLLQIKRRTFYELDAKGELPCRELQRIGRKRRFNAQDMAQYLAGHETPAEIASLRYFDRVRRASAAKQRR